MQPAALLASLRVADAPLPRYLSYAIFYVRTKRTGSYMVHFKHDLYVRGKRTGRYVLPDTKRTCARTSTGAAGAYPTYETFCAYYKNSLFR